MEWLIGFVAAAVFHLFGRMRRWLGFGQTKKDIMEGKWYEHHFSRRDNQAILRHNTIHIKRRSWSRFDVIFSAEEEYRGCLMKERDQVVIHLKTFGGYEGHFDMRLKQPIPENMKILPGLWMSFDFDGRLISGPMIFSQALLTDDEATNYLLNLVQVTHPDNRLLGLR